MTNWQDVSWGITWDRAVVPHWAVDVYKGSLVPGTQLSTQDGRRFGNAVVVSVEEVSSLFKSWLVASLVTDIGNKIELTTEQVEAYFHEPKWVMDLSTHSGYNVWQEDIRLGLD